MKFKNKYHQLFFSSPDPIFIENLDGIILDANQAALKMHGVTLENMVGKNFIEFIPKKQRNKIKSNVTTFIKNKTQVFESISTDASGNEIPIEITASVIDYNNEQAVLIHIRNIKKRKEIEKELYNSHEQLRNLSRHLQNIREIESTKIARDLHDILGQDLTALKFEISFTKRIISQITDNKSLQQELAKKNDSMLTLANNTLSTIRKITSNLRPTVLDDIGLVPGLEWLTIDFEKRTSIQTKLTTTINDSSFSNDFSTTIYRIIQEALTNVIRHANASEVSIIATEKKRKIELQIIDNGIGITSSQVQRTQSFGIVGIKERVLSYHGTFKISGKHNKGTTVYVTLPIIND